MLAKASAAGVKHMTYFTWRWVPYMRLVQKLVGEGFIGECYTAQLEYYGGYSNGDYYQWKWDMQHGLGVLGDLGSHMIDLARLLVGDITRVQAHLSPRANKPHPQGLAYEPANDSASLMMRFANGATGSLFASARVAVGSRGMMQRILLAGSEGTLEVNADALQYCVRGFRRGDADWQVFSAPAEYLAGSSTAAWGWEQMMQIFEHQSIGTRLFIDSILADCPVVPGFAEGVGTQEVIDAAVRSNQSGLWEEVN
jgi:predicted dehydrogenase